MTLIEHILYGFCGAALLLVVPKRKDRKIHKNIRDGLAFAMPCLLFAFLFYHVYSRRWVISTLDVLILFNLAFAFRASTLPNPWRWIPCILGVLPVFVLFLARM